VTSKKHSGWASEVGIPPDKYKNNIPDFLHKQIFRAGTRKKGETEWKRLSSPGPKFTNDLTTILRQCLDLRQSYDNCRIHRAFTTIVRPILRQNLMITS